MKVTIGELVPKAFFPYLRLCFVGARNRCSVSGGIRVVVGFDRRQNDLEPTISGTIWSFGTTNAAAIASIQKSNDVSIPAGSSTADERKHGFGGNFYDEKES